MGFHRITILGLGLMGGSVGRAIKKSIANCKITGYDHSADVLRRAVELATVDAALPRLTDACRDAELIVICVPIGEFAAVLTEAIPALVPGMCITDVCSTKRSPVAIARELLPKGVHFVAAHPMAGSDLSGIEAARADLFESAQCLITPTDEAPAEAIAAVESFWKSLGLRTRKLSPARHDELVAEISHLPHALASALMTAVSEDAMQLAGPGFRDVTRVAGGSGALWSDILTDNADEVRHILKGLRTQLDHLDTMLDKKDSKGLRAWLNAAAERRRRLKASGENRA